MGAHALRIVKSLKFAGLFACLLLGLGGCVSLFLEKSPSAASETPASPPALSAFETDPAVKTPQDWTERRAPILRQRFQDFVYGVAPAPYAAKVVSRTPLDLPETRG